MIKKLLVTAFVLLLLPVFAYLALVAHNNYGDDSATAEEVSASFEQSVQWLVDNRTEILNTGNPMLWWMVMSSHEITRDPRLGELFQAYQKRYVDGHYRNYWRGLFDTRYVAMFSPAEVSALPEYNQYFLYGLTCDKSLGQTAVIQRQTRTDFCSRHQPISPACVTHQMMGLYFRQQRGCGEAGELAGQMAELQSIVRSQLTWDPRVVDVYIQRVLMLTDTGVPEQVKGRWLHRVLAAQLADGGWSGFQPLLPLGGGKYLGFYAKGVTLGTPEADFHATVQGVLLTSLLSRQFPPR